VKTLAGRKYSALYIFGDNFSLDRKLSGNYTA
jgi:hypothetical protein